MGRPFTTPANMKGNKSPERRRKKSRGQNNELSMSAMESTSQIGVANDSATRALSPSFRPRSRAGHLKPLSQPSFITESAV